MKTLIEKIKKEFSFWKFYSEIAAQDHGANKRLTPRFIRRMLAGTRYHKAWMWGRMNPCATPRTYLQVKVRVWKRSISNKLFWLSVKHPLFWRILSGVRQRIDQP